MAVVTREQQLDAALRRIIRAVDDEGRNPALHRRVVAEVARRWPTLMRAINNARRFV